jgi:DNA repair ATPase RecN
VRKELARNYILNRLSSAAPLLTSAGRVDYDTVLRVIRQYYPLVTDVTLTSGALDLLTDTVLAESGQIINSTFVALGNGTDADVVSTMISTLLNRVHMLTQTVEGLQEKIDDLETARQNTESKLDGIESHDHRLRDVEASADDTRRRVSELSNTIERVRSAVTD